MLRPWRHLPIVLCGLLLQACTTPPGAEDDSDVDAGSFFFDAGGADAGSAPDAGPVDGGAGDGGAVPIACAGSPATFPSFDKSCQSNVDCSYGLHQTNCCGSQEAIGFNSAQAAVFAADEKLCDAMYPGCGCDSGEVRAEDGNSVASGESLGVSCNTGHCMTFVMQ